MRLLSFATSDTGRRRATFLLLCLPWLWLLLLALQVGEAVLIAGHLPFYGHPAPRHSLFTTLLYYPTLLLTVPLLISPFLWLALSAGPQNPEERPAALRRTLLFLLGYICFILVVVGDLGMLMTWLLN